MQKVSDPPVTTCEKCSGSTRKVISPAGLVFKGSGWYITDYAAKDKAHKESAEKKGGENREEKKDTPQCPPVSASKS